MPKNDWGMACIFKYILYIVHITTVLGLALVSGMYGWNCNCEIWWCATHVCWSRETKSNVSSPVDSSAGNGVGNCVKRRERSQWKHGRKEGETPLQFREGWPGGAEYSSSFGEGRAGGYAEACDVRLCSTAIYPFGAHIVYVSSNLDCQITCFLY